MVGNDNKQKTNGEIDRFSRFMFGNSKHRETYKESENHSQEILEQNEHSSFDRNSNRSITDRFGPMIGFLALGEKNLRKVLQPLKIR